MKNPILKSIIRRPIKFVLLILILSLVSGAFIMNFTSYSLVSKEVESAKGAYNSIGYLQMDLSDGSDGNVYEIRELLKDDPMIAYEDCRIWSLGVSDNLLNAANKYLEDDFLNEHPGMDFFAYDLFVIVRPENIRTRNYVKDKYDGVTLEGHVQKLIAGYPDWIYMPDSEEMFEDGFFSLIAQKYENSSKADGILKLIPYINDAVLDELYGLEIGADYLFRCEPMSYDALHMERPNSYMLKPLYDGGPLYEKIDNIDEFNLDGPKWQKMREDIELLDMNTRAFSIIATKNMETHPYTQGNLEGYTLYDGRWINYDDYKNNNKVCVVGKNLFEARKLKLGDKISLQYMECEIPVLLVTEKDRKEWKNYHKSDVIEYEIVGVYSNYSSGKTIYVPTSTVPKEFLNFHIDNGKPYLFSQCYSFVLKNPAEQSQFIEKYGDSIKEAGFELQFIENNAETFWISADKVLNNLKINILLYGILLIFAMLFIIYMYIEIYKKNYAIERILGFTHKSASRHLLMPLYIFAAMGIGLSYYFGYQTAIKNSKKILEGILGKLPNNLDSSISVKLVFLIFLTIIGVFVILSLFMVFRLKARSLLEFFSEEKNKKKVQDVDADDLDIIDNEFHTDDLADVLSFDDSNINISKGKTVLKGYGKKHISRSIVTTILMVVVTGLLIGTLTWLINVIESNQVFIDKTISETTVYGEIEYIGEAKFSYKGYISEDILNKILETGLVEDYFGVVDNEYSEINIDRNGIKETIKRESDLDLAYYEKHIQMTILASNKELNSDNGIKLSGIEDQSIVGKINSYTLIQDEIPILASTEAMDTYNLEIGHKVSLKDAGSNYPDVYGTIVGTFESYGFPTHDAYYEQHLIPSDCVHETFIFPIDAVRLIERNGINYVKIDLLFDKEKNAELYDNREEILNRIAKTTSGDSTGYKLVLYDDILTETIGPLEKNLELLSIIYPIILVLSLIIAVVLPYLLILRRSEELAIMRILGVKEVEVKRYVFTENLTLIIIGEVIAIAVISAVTFKSGVCPIWKYLFVIVGYLLASIIGVLASLKNVLYKKPLEMLQVKE